MPPKKIDPKLVTKSITSFGFNKITKAEAELRLLEENLQAQKLKVNREHEQRKKMILLTQDELEKVVLW